VVDQLWWNSQSWSPILSFLHGVNVSEDFFSMVQQPLVGHYLPIFKAPHFDRTSLDEWSAESRNLYLTTHNTRKRQTSMQLGGIRNHNPNKWAAADPRLRPHGHWDYATRQQAKPSVKLTKEGFLRNYCNPFCLSCYIQKIIDFSNHNGTSPIF
jgi:hypothetical protein